MSRGPVIAVFVIAGALVALIILNTGALRRDRIYSDSGPPPAIPLSHIDSSDYQAVTNDFTITSPAKRPAYKNAYGTDAPRSAPLLVDDVLIVKVEGSYSAHPTTQGMHDADGPDGTRANSYALVPGAPVGGVVAAWSDGPLKNGSPRGRDSYTRPFFIGRGTTLSVKQPGLTLHFALNENPDFNADNTGRYTIHITHLRPRTP